MRLYAYLSQILPYADPEQEKLYSFGRLLLPHLPLDRGETLQAGVVGRALQVARLVEHAGERFDLAPEVHLGAVQIVFQRLQPGRVGRRLHFRAVVVRLERPEDVLGAVDEVEDERRVLAGRSAVEPRERLHRLHPVEPLVDIHRAQQRRRGDQSAGGVLGLVNTNAAHRK